MIERLKLNRILLTLFVVCTVVRIIFIFGTEQIHVMWDARIYSSAALGLIYYSDHTDRFGHPELPTQEDSLFYRGQFNSLAREYINGEKIDWLYYDTPSIQEAQQYLFISGPVYPAYLAAVFLITPHEDFTVVRCLNVIIDGLCLILLMLIANILFGKKTAVVAGLVYIFYLPFILLTGVVSPEPITLFLTLAALYCLLKWNESLKAGYIYVSGLILGLLVLTRPTAGLLILPFLFGFIYDNRQKIKKIVAPVLKGAIPFLAAVLPWVIITSGYFDQLAVRDPQYAEANIRSSSSVKFEGYDLDYTEDDFWSAPVIEDVKSDIPGYVTLMAKKLIRLWVKPFNDFRRSFILNKGAADIYHFAVIIFALFGIFLFLVNKRPGLIYLFLIPAYYTLIHIIFHSLARYNLNAMPVIILAGSAVLVKIFDYLSEKHRTKDLNRLIVGISVIFAGGIFIWLFPESAAAAYLGPIIGIILLLLVKLAIVLTVLYWVYRFTAEVIGRTGALTMFALPSLVLVLVLLLTGSGTTAWAEWKCTLTNPRQSAGNMIFIPGKYALAEGEAARIGIDMVTKKDMINPVNVVINGVALPLHINEPPMDEFYYKKATYHVYGKLLNLGKEEIRAWRFIPLNRDIFNRLLSMYGVIDIAVNIADSAAERDAYIDIFGNYDIADSGRVIVPSLTHHSIERFVEKGDPRSWLDYPLSSDSVISYYMDDLTTGRANREDLSLSGGLQSGRFRIFVEIKRLDGSRQYF